MSVINTAVPETEELVADVLRRSHQTAEAADAPDEERVILRVAHLFAEDLAKTDPSFDHTRFIESITRHVA